MLKAADLAKEGFKLILLSVFIVSGAAISKLLPKDIALQNALLGIGGTLAIVIVIVGASVLSARYFQSQALEKSIEQLSPLPELIERAAVRHRDQGEETLRGLSGLIRAGYPEWLITEEALRPVESEATGKDIWIASPDLKNDTYLSEDHDLLPVIKGNAKRGVIYTYFIPDKPELASAENSLRDVFADFPQRLKVVKIRADEWDKCFIAHVMVLNPRSELQKKPRVYLELPIKGRGHWIAVDDEVAPKMFGRLQLFLQHQGSAALPAHAV